MSVKVILLDNIEKRLEYLIKNLKENVNNKSFEKLFVIVPEQFNFACQKKILEKLNVDVISEIEILSFTRLIHRIYEEINYFKPNISNIEKEIVIKDIVEKMQDNFIFFNKYKVTEKMITEICNVINLIVRNMINEEDIEKYIKANNTILSNKLSDVYLIYSEYKKYLEKLDMDFKVVDVVEKIAPLCQILKSTKIYISDFYNFTNEQVKIVEILKNNGCDIDIVMQERKYESTSNHELNIFSNINRNIEKFYDKEIINLNEEYLKEDIKEDENIKLKKSEELISLCNMYAYDEINAYEKETKDLFLTTFKTKSSELLDVAFNIMKHIGKGYRYKDISIVVNGIDNYKLEIEDILCRFNIPFIIDDRKTLYDSKIIRIINKLFEIVINNYNTQNIISLLKENEFKYVDIDDVNKLENIVLKNGILNIKDLYIFFEKDDKKNMNSNISMILEFIKTNIDENMELTVQEYSGFISNFLNKFVVEDFIDYSSEDIERISKILTTWGNVSEKKYGALEFYSNFSSFAKDVTIDKMQGKIDEVEIYDKIRTNMLQTKIMIMIGFSDKGNTFGKLTNIFTEKENKILKENNMEFNVSYIDLIVEQRFLFYNMIDKASEKIFISYVDNEAGMKVDPDSEIIKIKNKFINISKLSINEDEIINNYLINDDVIALYITKYISNINKNQEKIKLLINMLEDKERARKLNDFVKSNEVRIDYEFDSCEETEILNKNELNELNLSFSSIETYVKCPFQYFLTYVLRLKEKETYKIDAKLIGTATHEILEKIFKKIIKKEIEIDKYVYTNEQIKELVSDVIKEENIFNEQMENENYKEFVERFKNVMVMNIKNLFEQVRHGKFEVSYVEEPFGKENLINGIEFEVNNKHIVLSGKIDRVDLYHDENDKLYLKVIDYKTGNKKFSLEDIKLGLNTQLIIYLKVLLEHLKDKNPIPAGIFISQIQSDMKKDEELELKDNKYSGLVLDDKDILEKLDCEYRDSKILPIKLKKDSDEYAYPTKDNAISEEKFKKIIDETLEKIKNIASDISVGIMDVGPNENVEGVCEYCKYKTICEFDDKRIL